MLNKDDKNIQAKMTNLYKRQKHLLNEKLIFTHYFEREYEEECRRNDYFDDYFNERMMKLRDVPLLDISQKYDVVRNELQNAHTKWENFEKKKDERTDELLAQNQEVIASIKDIKMEVYELNRKIDTQGENKNGKINAEVFNKFFDEKFKKLDNMKKKLKEQVEILNKQIIIASKKIEKKDSNNELQFIDFHQLQIENKKYVKEVDEKNKLLLKLKMTIGKITEDKNNIKQKLNNELVTLSKAKNSILDKDKQIKKIDEMTTKEINIKINRDKETTLLHNKLVKSGKLEVRLLSFNALTNLDRSSCKAEEYRTRS